MLYQYEEYLGPNKMIELCKMNLKGPVMRKLPILSILQSFAPPPQKGGGGAVQHVYLINQIILLKCQ